MELQGQSCSGSLTLMPRNQRAASGVHLTEICCCFPSANMGFPPFKEIDANQPHFLETP